MPLLWQDEEDKNKAKEEKRQAREDAAAKMEEKRQALAAEGKSLKGRPRKNDAAHGRSRARAEKKLGCEDGAGSPLRARTEKKVDSEDGEGSTSRGKPDKELGSEDGAGSTSRARTKKLGCEDGEGSTSRARAKAVKEKELLSAVAEKVSKRRSTADKSGASKRSDSSMDKDVEKKKRKTKDDSDKDGNQKKRKSKDAAESKEENQKKRKTKDDVDSKEENQKKRKTKDAVDSKDENQKKRKAKDAVDNKEEEQKRSSKNDDKGEDCGTDPKRQKILDNMSLVQKTKIVELEATLGDRKTYTVRPPKEKQHEVKGIGVVLQSQSFYVTKCVLAEHLWPGDMAKMYKAGAWLYDMFS